MKELLGQVIFNELADKTLFEVRLKVGRPLIYYTPNGRRESRIVVSEKMMNDFLSVASEGSFYTIADKMKEGYISYKGMRIGIAGEYLSDGYSPTIIKKVTSAVVRVPRQILDCSLSVNSLNKNVLVAAPVFSGKTTFLRDLARRAANEGKRVVVIDERKELSMSGALDLGNADVLEGLPKRLAYVNAIRALSPEIIVTDELLDEEFAVVKKIIRSGVKVYASFHTDSLDKIPEELKVFNVYVALSNERVGKVEEIRYA